MENWSIATFIFFAFSSYLPYPLQVMWHALKYVCKISKVKYSSTNGTVNKHILKYVKETYIYSTEQVLEDNEYKPGGLILGKYYAIRIEEQEKHLLKFHLYCRNEKSFLQDIKDLDEQPSPKISDDISLIPKIRHVKWMMKRGREYKHLFYHKIDIPVLHEPTDGQDIIIRDIVHNYRMNDIKNWKCLITGNPGCGKSYIARFVAREINGIFINEFNPTHPGDTLSDILRDCNPTDKQPMVILLNEYDDIIKFVEDDSKIIHPNIVTCVYNKTTHNHFLDVIEDIPNIILILTTNVPKRWFDEVNESYLRSKRIDTVYTLL